MRLTVLILAALALTACVTNNGGTYQPVKHDYSRYMDTGPTTCISNGRILTCQ